MTAGLLGIAFGSYLLGSVPSGYLLGRLLRVDVRQSGSGNIGATNVARALGPGFGLATLTADVAKGFIAVTLARSWDAGTYASQSAAMSELPVAVAAVAVALGHIFSIFLHFRGGVYH